VTTLLLILYFAIGVGVYYLIARAIDRETGQAPTMGCLMWLVMVALWPVWVVGVTVAHLRRTKG
jgi:hypothetical protein